MYNMNKSAVRPVVRAGSDSGDGRIGVTGGQCGGSVMPLFCPALVLKVEVTVLADSDGRRDLQTLDFRLEAAAFLAEELSTVATVVSALGQGEAHAAAGAAVPALVLHPVVSGGAAGLLANRPAEHSTTAISHQHLTVVFGDGEGSDLRWVPIVLAVEGCVHGQFAPEHQLSLPPVACSELVVSAGLSGANRALADWGRGAVRAPGLVLRVVDKHKSVFLV